MPTTEDINTYFLTCFISLLIARAVEMRPCCKYTIKEIKKASLNVACNNIDQNIWLFDYSDDLIVDITTAFGTDFGRKVMTL